MSVLWYTDIISGFRVPLASGFRPSYNNGILSIYSSSSLFSSYGVSLTHDPIRITRRILNSVSRSLKGLGVVSSPSVSKVDNGYEVRYILQGRSLVVSIRFKLMGRLTLTRSISYLEGEGDPSMLWELASMIELVKPVASTKIQIPDPLRGMEAYNLVVPQGWNVDGGITMTMDPFIRIVGGGHRLEVNVSKYMYGNGMMFQMIASQLAGLGYGIGEYIDARTLASQMGEWRVMHESSPPAMALYNLGIAIASRFMGLWSDISSVIASTGQESLWVSNIGVQHPIPGELLVEWTSYVARAYGPRSLDILLSIMANFTVNERWLMTVHRENMKKSREMRRIIGSRGSYTPGPSISSYSYSSSYDYESPADYYSSDYSGYDADYESSRYDEYSSPGYGGDYDYYGDYQEDSGDYGVDDTGYSDREDDYMEDEEGRGLRRFRSDTGYTQFYVDDEGRLRSYDHDEEIAASFIDQDGYLKDEKGDIIGRLEDGWVVDEESGERIGVLNTKASDDYQLERLEETMLNPEESLGYTPTAPDDEMRDINPYYVSKKREDND